MIRLRKPIESLLIVSLAIITLLPLLGIIFSMFNTDVKNLVLDAEVYSAIKGSAITMFGTVAFTIPVSLMCAFCVTHTNIKFQTAFSFFLYFASFFAAHFVWIQLACTFWKKWLIIYCFWR